MKNQKNNILQFFKLAIELEEEFKWELIKNDVHFRPNLNSLSLISVNSIRPELGVQCKKHQEWTIDILHNYIKKILSKPVPQRSTPEKSLQAWIIKESQRNENNLPFDSSLKFIASELAIPNKNGKKIVSDILYYDTLSGQLVIVELKSDRHLKRLIEQVNNFEKIIHDNFRFFKELVRLNGYDNLERTLQKTIIWPHKRTSPLKKLKKLHIGEYTYEVNGNNYSFIDHKKHNRIELFTLEYFL